MRQSSSLLLAGMLALAGPALLAQTAQAQSLRCDKLCASWVLDAAASTDVAAAIDAAVDTYKEEKVRRIRSGNDIASLERAELEEGLGPMRLRPQREELRTQLQHQLKVPAQLRLSLNDDVVLVDEGGTSPRRFEPGQPYSRVDSIGTAKITIRLQGSVFEVVENYGKGRSNRESYAAADKGARLTVTRTLSRPGMKDIKIQSVYAPAAAS
jgi:hypothetical protein